MHQETGGEGPLWTMSGSCCRPIANSHITVKELAPIVIAAAIWGNRWEGKAIRVYCDNMAVVSIVNSGTSKNPEAMHLMRCLVSLAAKRELHLQASHIKGVHNTQADTLSWNNLPLFRSLHPQAAAQAAIPAPLLDILLLREPDWTSKSWTEQWSSIL